MINKELKNKAEETEILSADDERLHQMLAGLKKINAPKDFDFHLKARIANTKPRDLRQSAFLPFLRYALPLSVIILLAGFVFFNLSLSNGTQQNAPNIAADNFQPIQNEIAPPDLPEKPAIEAPLTASANANKNLEIKPDVPKIINTPKKSAQDNLKYVAVKNPASNRTGTIENKSTDDFQGTRDTTTRDAPVLYERNRNMNSNSAKTPGIEQHRISLREVLAGIGIEADYVAKSWKILSVRENSPAMRAELKVGDVIEAIDDKKLSSDSVFLKTFSAKVFRVLRDGKQIVISLTEN